jgi:hypothetical protein
VTTDDRFAVQSTAGGLPAAAEPDAGPAARFDDGFFGGAVAGSAGSAPFGGAAAPLPTSVVPSATGPLPQAGLSDGRWKIVAAAAALVAVVVLVVAGRFGWQQFVADPVVPDTLAGMPLLSGPEVAAQTDAAVDGMRRELGSGSAAKVGVYTNGQDAGFILFSLRGGNRPGASGSDSSDPFAGWAKTDLDGATCWSKPAQATTGMGVTFCMKGLWRRAVVVMGLAATPMDPSLVARATNEAWDAQ